MTHSQCERRGAAPQNSPRGHWRQIWFAPAVKRDQTPRRFGRHGPEQAVLLCLSSHVVIEERQECGKAPPAAASADTRAPRTRTLRDGCDPRTHRGMITTAVPRGVETPHHAVGRHHVMRAVVPVHIGRALTSESLGASMYVGAPRRDVSRETDGLVERARRPAPSPG